MFNKIEGKNLNRNFGVIICELSKRIYSALEGRG
jgi:hypothetical protein